MFPKFLKNKYLVGFIVILVIGIGAALWFFGFAPVLSVEGKNVNAGEFAKIEAAITQFNTVSHASATSTLPVEIKKQVLGNLIDRMLLDKLVAQTDPSISQKAADLVKDTIAKNTNFSIADAAQKLYGLSVDDFTDLVLIPQAKRNLVAEHYKDDPSKLNAIWDDLTKNSKVTIYYPGFYYENGEVKVK